MTDDRLPSAADDEMLSAYLLGELSDADARAFEARLAAYPILAARLDALAAALATMGRHDEAEPPEGFEQRLDDRLAQARAGATGVTSLDVARERRARSTRWWTTVGTVAAVVALGAVMATSALRGVGGGMATDDTAQLSRAADTATDMALEESAADDAAEYGAQASGQGDAGATADMDEAAAGGAVPARPNAPVLLDEQAVVADEAALQERYAGAPEILGLLGMPVEEAAPVAASFSAAVQRAEPFGGGAAPGDCLDTVTTAADQPLIPARVETVRYNGRQVLAYVMVTASADASQLDRVEIWVVAPGDCTTLVFQQL